MSNPAEMPVFAVRRFPRDLHAKLRVHAAVHGTSIRAVVVEAIEQHLWLHPADKPDVGAGTAEAK